MCLACAALPGAATGAVPFPETSGPLPWSGEAEHAGRLTWTGTAGLRVDLAGTSIAFDPFVSRPGLWRVLFGRPHPDVDRVAEHYADLDAVFVGHTHYDHAMDLAAVADASPRAVIHGSPTTVELCRRLGVAEDRLVVVEDAARYHVGPFFVEAVRSAHGKVPLVRFVDRYRLPRRGLPWTPFRYPRGDVYAWRFEAGGRSVHVQGSAGIDDRALLRQPPADALVACLAARHGTPDYLKRLGERLRPDVLIPIHHDDFFRSLDAPPRPVSGLDWPGFLADARALEAAHGTRLHCPPLCVGMAW